MNDKIRIIAIASILIVLTGLAAYQYLGPLSTSVSAPPNSQEETTVTPATDKNEDPNRTENGWPVLVEAAYRGDQSEVNRLIQLGADIERKGPEGWTALMQAAGNNHQDITELLLKQGAAVNTENSAGKNAYELAVERGHTTIAQGLLQAGAADNELRLFIRHAYMGRERAMHEMIKEGIDVNRRDYVGRSALFYTLSKQHSERYADYSYKLRPNMISRLLGSGADPSLRDHNGKTPLIAFVSEYGPVQQIIALLLDHGSDVTATDTKGQNILFYLLDETNFRKTIELGVAVNHTNHEGDTPMHKWIRGMNSEMVTQLLESGADLTMQNAKGQYPLDLFPETNPGGKLEKNWSDLNKILSNLPKATAPRSIEKPSVNKDEG